MMRKTYLAMVCIALLLTNAARGIPVSAQENQDNLRKGLEISYSYDDEGKLSKIRLQSNQVNDATNLRALIKREDAMAVIEEIIPLAKRGEKVREIRGSFGRAWSESTVFEKVQLDLTLTCYGDVCGVSFAEVTWRGM